MSKLVTTKDWVTRSKKVWGNTFTYSNTRYISSSTKITVTCKKHGDFKVHPGNHLTKGSGCPLCGKHKRRTTTSFIKEASAKYDNKFDYSKTVFKGVDVTTTIVCPIHGEFEQTPYNHLNSAEGCTKCGYNSIAVSRSISQEQYVEAATIAHNNLYTYTHLVYVGIKGKVEITCSEHGTFWQTADNHLHLLHGCPTCADEARTYNRLTTEQFVEKAIAKWGVKNDYTSVEYINTHTPITFMCVEHGNFKQRPSNHLTGYEGCPQCVTGGGFKHSKPGVCYLMTFDIEGKIVYKVGVTNNTIQSRYCISELKHCILVISKSFDIGREAYIMEQYLLNKYKQYKYEGDPILKTGNTELLTGPVGTLEEEWK